MPEVMRLLAKYYENHWNFIVNTEKLMTRERILKEQKWCALRWIGFEPKYILWLKQIYYIYLFCLSSLSCALMNMELLELDIWILVKSIKWVDNYHSFRDMVAFPCASNLVSVFSCSLAEIYEVLAHKRDWTTQK